MNTIALLPALDVVAGVLVVSGLAKLREPDPAGAMLRSLGLPSSREAVRVTALAELAVGISCIVHSSSASITGVAALYLAFAGVAFLTVTRRAEISSCGCFGARDASPSWLHIGFNVAAAVTALLALRWPPPDLLSLWRTQPAAALIVAAGITTGIVLAATALAHLPDAFNSYRRDPL